MPGAEVRHIPYEGHSLEIVGRGNITWDKYYGPVGPMEVMGPASIASMRKALLRPGLCCVYESDDGEVRLNVSKQKKVASDSYNSPIEPIQFLLHKDYVAVQVDIFLTNYELDENVLARTLKPWLARHKCELLDITEEGTAMQFVASVTFAPPIRNRTLADAYRLGEDVFFSSRHSTVLAP